MTKPAALYARVSSDRQKENNTIASQVAALTQYAETNGYLVPPEWQFQDDGHSGATLVRPGLEALRDLAAEGQIQAVLIYSPDRLSRKYAYQVLLAEELARCGVELIFLRAPSGATAEDQLLVQFQGMIAEYERAQIAERSRRGKRHRAQQGSINVLSGAPYGYRYVKKTDTSAAYYEVVESEALARSATVLLVDLSMSMPMRDNFVPAKRMAMALETLISSRFPRDYLGIVGFSEVAREIRPDELPTAMWDYVYGTNLQHALALSRRMLAHQHGTKQIIVVTDGEPTAHIDDRGEVFFNYPPVPETLQRTMAEVIRCTRAGIIINCFALDLERTHYPFVEQIARVNGGRTFYTTPDALGGYVLVDFLKHRRVLRPAG